MDKCPYCGRSLLRKFTLHWRGQDKSEIIEGNDIADAFRRYGYGGGALSALDWHEEILVRQAD